MAESSVKTALMQWLLAEPVTRVQIHNEFKISDEEFFAKVKSNLASNEVDIQSISYPLLIGDDPKMSTETKIQMILYMVCLSFRS